MGSVSSVNHSLHEETIREVLPNGLVLLVRQDRSAPVVSIVTYVKTGYFDERDDQVGLAHVLEHMYFKGTATRRPGEIARETKTQGGYLNAHTIYDHTSYYTVLPSQSFEAGLDIQFDAYAHSALDAVELARELEVIVQEVKRKRDTPSAVALEALYELMHDRHRIRRWRMGREDALRAFDRNQLAAFYQNWYRPSNTILAVVGDVDPELVRRAVVVRHGALANHEPVRSPWPAEDSASGFRYRDWPGEIAEQQLVFGWRTPCLRDPDSAALEMAGVILGTGRASRLYRALREQQLASSVSAWNYTTGDLGVFVSHAQVPAERAAQACRTMWREIQAAREDGLREPEIQRARRILEARQLRRLESMDGQAQYLAAWEARGGLDLAAAYQDRLLSLSAADVQAALQAHLSPESVSVLSYRPEKSEPLAVDAASMHKLLDQAASAGSEVPATPARGVAAVSSRGEADDASFGARLFHTARGVPVIVVPRPGAPLVHMGVFVRGGAVLDAPEREGLARLTAHAMLKGSGLRSGAEIAEAAEGLGSSIAVSVGMESVGWIMSVPPDCVGEALDLLAAVVERPAFPVDGVETERAMAQAAVRRQRDDMYRWPLRLAMSAAFGEHAYARSTLGTEASLASLSRADVTTWHARNVLRSHAVIVVVGDLSASRTAELVARSFPVLECAEDRAVPAVQWPQSRRVNSELLQREQTALALVFPGPSRTDPDRHAIRVLCTIASGLGGRLFEQLRDRQSLAYTVRTSAVERRMTGAVVSYIATSPERENEAREGLLRELARFGRETPSQEEMGRAKRYLMGTQAIARQSGETIMSELVDAWLFGEGLSEPEYEMDRIFGVSAEDVKRVAERCFREGTEAEGLVQGRGARTEVGGT